MVFICFFARQHTRFCHEKLEEKEKLRRSEKKKPARKVKGVVVEKSEGRVRQRRRRWVLKGNKIVWNMRKRLS